MPLSTAQSLGWNLARTMMMVIVLVETSAGYAVMPLPDGARRRSRELPSPSGTRGRTPYGVDGQRRAGSAGRRQEGGARPEKTPCLHASFRQRRPGNHVWFFGTARRGALLTSGGGLPLRDSGGTPPGRTRRCVRQSRRSHWLHAIFRRRVRRPKVGLPPSPRSGRGRSRRRAPTRVGKAGRHQLFAAHPVAIAVKMARIAGVTAADGRCAGGAGRRTIRKRYPA